MSNKIERAASPADALQALLKRVEAALEGPKAMTSDQLCEALAAEAQRPNAFKKRVVRRRRALDQGGGGVDGSGSGGDEAAGAAIAAAPRPKHRHR